MRCPEVVRDLRSWKRFRTPRSMQQYGTAEWMPCEASRRMLDEPVEAHPVVGTCSKGVEASEVKLGGCEKAGWRLPQQRRARGD